MAAFAWWERYESRDSRTVLRGTAGEVPAVYSPKALCMGTFSRSNRYACNCISTFSRSNSYICNCMSTFSRSNSYICNCMSAFSISNRYVSNSFRVYLMLFLLSNLPAANPFAIVAPTKSKYLAQFRLRFVRSLAWVTEYRVLHGVWCFAFVGYQ